MNSEIDLDDIELSPFAVEAWMKIAEVAARYIVHKMKEDKNLLVIPPDERARLNDDGSITIFVDMPGGVIEETSMNVPVGQWKYKKEKEK